MEKKGKKHETEVDEALKQAKDREATSEKKECIDEKRFGSERRMTDRRSGEDRRQQCRRESDFESANIGTFEDPKVGVLQSELESRDEDIKRHNDEIATLKDLLQRRQADFENYKKRMLKFQEDQKKFAIKDLALDIIMINDDLHRAIEASTNFEVNGGSTEEGHKSFVEGVNMIANRIEEMLQKYGVVEVQAMNMDFNPNVHEAVEIEMSSDYEKDTVTKVYQKGFCIDDLVIRSAKVKVAKSAPEKIKDNTEDRQSDS